MRVKQEKMNYKIIYMEVQKKKKIVRLKSPNIQELKKEVKFQNQNLMIEIICLIMLKIKQK